MKTKPPVNACRLFWALLGACTLFLPQIASAQENWSLQSPTTKPLNRFGEGLTYDSAAKTTVMFGGRPLNFVAGVTPPVYNDTWLWSNGNWSQALPATSPDPRYDPAMAYDPVKGQVLLFGGLDHTGDFLSDTWAWDGNTWAQLAFDGPPGRTEAAVVYDPQSGKMILFGGRNFNDPIGYYNDTWVWSWDTNTWTQLTPPTSPAKRARHRMVYDVARQQVVLFGGTGPIPGAPSGVTTFGDTWTWNGSNWIQQTPVTVPLPRYFQAMAFDPSQSQVLMYGGEVNGNTCGTDTWSWNGINWQQLLPVVNPGCKVDAAMDYDTGTGGVIFFGGSGNTPADETWLFAGAPAQTSVMITVPPGIQFAFNGQTYTGTSTIDVVPGSYSLSTPSPQTTGSGSQAAWVSWSDGGGQAHSVPVGSSAVSITGTFKTQYQLTEIISPSGGGSISPGSGYYDAGTVVGLLPAPSAGYIFSSWGGDCSGGACSVTMNAPRSVTANFSATATTFPVTIVVPTNVQYMLNGVTYTGTHTVLLLPGTYPLSTGSPQATAAGTQAVFVSWSDGGAQSHSIVVAGASAITGVFKTQYLLTYTATPAGAGTFFLFPTGPYYDAGTEVSISAFPAKGFTFYYWTGDCMSSGVTCSVILDRPRSVTAHFDGQQAWVQLFPPNIPTPRQDFAMAYDEPRDEVVLFGGTDSKGNPLGDTWVFDGTTWTERHPTGPRPKARSFSRMAYDAATQQVILFGGAATNETWLWNGNTVQWTLLSPAVRPSPRFGHAMAYDANSKKLVLFGGASAFGGTVLGDTWLWDGTNWQPGPASGPSPRVAAVLAPAPPPTGGLVLFGGETDPVFSVEGLIGDTWAWDGSSWSLRVPSVGPPTAPLSRNFAGMAYDAFRRNTVLFSGFGNGFGGTAVGDSWVWNDLGWDFRVFTGFFPNARADHSMVYDSRRHRIVLFGGAVLTGVNTYTDWNDTWIYTVPTVDFVLQSIKAGPLASGFRDVTLVLQNQGDTPLPVVTVTSATMDGVPGTFVGATTASATLVGGTMNFKAKFPLPLPSGVAATVTFQGGYSIGYTINVPWTITTTITMP